MKKVVFAILALSLSAACASAQSSTTPNAVLLKAVVPEFISIVSSGVPQVNFNATAASPNYINGDGAPAFTLKYNLAGSKTITVCAYITPLTGTDNTNSVVVQPGWVNFSYGKAQFGSFNSTCNGQSNAFVLDTIAHASSSTGTQEAFTGMFIQTPGSGYALPPDTYSGNLNVIAQAQ